MKNWFKKLRVKTAALAFMAAVLGGCVTVGPEQVEFVRLNGVVTFKEPTLLPAESTVLVAVIDAAKPGVILSQTEYEVAKLPIPYFFAIEEEKIDKKADYVVWASIRVKGRTILQSYQRYPVINNKQLTSQVLVEPLR